MERVAVYIDGGNTYRRLKALEFHKKFDFNAFVAKLVGEREIVSKRYYVGIVRNHDNTDISERLVRKQQQFLDKLRSAGFDVKPGKIMYDSGAIREKGVDVKLAVDLVVGAVDDRYDTAIVVSSDTDLIPAIKYIASEIHNKRVEYIGFEGQVSHGMLRECSSQRVFAKQDLIGFKESE